MKSTISFFLILLLFTFFSAAAQSQETTPPQPEKFYIGVSFSNTPYYLQPKFNSSADSRYNPNFVTYPALNVGYKLSKRASIQIGLAYAQDKKETGYEYNNNGVIEGNYSVISTRGGIIPLTFRYNFLNIGKRLSFFGTSSITAAFGKSHVDHTSTVNEEVIDKSQFEKAAFNMYLSLGLGMKYKISKRIDVFGEMLLLHKNLNSGNKNPVNTFNVGFNYKFR